MILWDTRSLMRPRITRWLLGYHGVGNELQFVVEGMGFLIQKSACQSVMRLRRYCDSKMRRGSRAGSDRSY